MEEIIDKLRREAVAPFRRFTWHDFLAANLYHINILIEAASLLRCKRTEPMDKYHPHT